MSNHVEVLLPVWGGRHIESCLTTTIASLLAPGNLPALAGGHSVDLVFLTSSADTAAIVHHKNLGQARNYAGCRFINIDDLITGGSYGFVLTLAIMRAIFRHGAKMKDVYFIPMMSDFVLGDGSLAALGAAIDEGYPAVFAPTWRTVEEDSRPLLESLRTRDGAIVASARGLADVALRHPHPTLLAGMARGGALRTNHYNQLYWSVDARTLVARQMLMHLFCIRPEVDISDVTGFFDYVLFERCCPSGKYTVLGDSDRFMAVELQAIGAEIGRLSWGPNASPEEIAADLASWTTGVHRVVGQHNCILHSAGLSENLGSVLDEIEDYMSRIYALLPPPLALDGHPYWEAGLANFGRAPIQQKAEPSPSIKQRLISLTVRGLLGTPGNVTPLHPRWSEYRAIRRMLGHSINDASQIVVCSPSVDLMRGLLHRDVAFVDFKRLDLAQSDLAGCDVIVLDLEGEDYFELERALAKLCALLVKRTEIILIMRRDVLSGDNGSSSRSRLEALRAIAVSRFACHEVSASGGWIGDFVISWGRVAAGQVWVGTGFRLVKSALKGCLALSLALLGNIADLLWPTGQQLAGRARVVVVRLSSDQTAA